MTKIREIFKNYSKFSKFESRFFKDLVKVYVKNSKARIYQRKFPFIDIFPFIDMFPSTENKTHHIREYHKEFYNVAKANIYPLVLRPLGKYWLPAPKNAEAFESEIGVRNIYKFCLRGHWNHRMEEQQVKKTILCKDLAAFYPFVQKVCKQLKGANVCVEILGGKTTVYLFYFDNRPIVITLEQPVQVNENII